MSWTTWLVAVTVAILYLILARVRAWYRLRYIKGPFWAAFSKWWMMRKTMGGQMHLDLARVCEQYGRSSKRLGDQAHLENALQRC